jgi:hypothetical protein
MNEQEKNRSIEYILSQGLVKPQTARTRITEMVRTMGVRYIFWDTGYSLFFAGITIAFAVFLFAVVIQNDTNYNYSYSAAVAVAPLLFLLITAFAETSERACGLYELKQTCRYTVRQITALRIICYSIAGALFTAVISLTAAKDAYQFLSLFTLCLSALFICAAISLAAMRYLRNKWFNAVYSFLWVFANIALTFSLNKNWETALSGVPLLISLILAVFGGMLLVYQISKMLSEGKTYAVA